MLMSPIAEALKKEHTDKKEYLQNELKSLGIEPDHLLQNQPMTKRRSFKHWQKASSQPITKLIKQHIAVVAVSYNDKKETFAE
jgi:hypothetical protein